MIINIDISMFHYTLKNLRKYVVLFVGYSTLEKNWLELEDQSNEAFQHNYALRVNKF